MVDQEEIHKKYLHKYPKENRGGTHELNLSFEYFFDKKKAYEDLRQCTSEKDSSYRRRSLVTLENAFRYISDKKQAWEVLNRLISEEDSNVRRRATETLGNYFRHICDRKLAWEVLSRLTSEEDSNVREGAIEALRTAFPYIPDKEQALKNLHRLTSDEDRTVRWETAKALTTIFQYISDKKQAWEDLVKLASDKDSYVRANAYNSLGRISIYKASQSANEEEYVEELEKAIEFFEKASQETIWKDPSSFCLPFYRSFYMIIHAQKQQAKDEFEKYLTEAKNAIEGSENKKLLFEAVENLANALREVQDLESMDLETKKKELDFYRKYCDKTVELLNNTEEKLPYATVVMRKGLPILSRNIKDILEEIQEKARTACLESQGTATEKIACAVSREVQKWEIGSQEEMTWYVENLIFTLESSVPKSPENKSVFDKIEQIREEKILVRQYAILCSIIPMIPYLHVNKTLSEIKNKVYEINGKVDHITISLKQGFSEELVITVGGPIPHFSVDHVVTISLQEISYREIQEDLEKIKGKSLDKLFKFPNRLSGKIKDYLIRNKMESFLEKLT